MSRQTPPEKALSCPFVIWLLSFIATMLAGTLLTPTLSEFLGQPWLRYPGVIVAAASFIGLVSFQVTARRAAACPWLPLDLGARVALVGVAFLVGLVVIYPAVNLRGEVLLPFRIVGIVCLASVLAYTGLHLRSHRMPTDAGLGDRLLLTVARVPFFLLCAIVLVIVGVGVIEIITAHP
jgi:hypothetical protein